MKFCPERLKKFSSSMVIGSSFGILGFIDFGYAVSQVGGNLFEAGLSAFPALALTSAACSFTEEAVKTNEAYHVPLYRKMIAAGAGIGGIVAFGLWISGDPNLVLKGGLGTFSTIVGTLNMGRQYQEFTRVHRF